MLGASNSVFLAHDGYEKSDGSCFGDLGKGSCCDRISRAFVSFFLPLTIGYTSGSRYLKWGGYYRSCSIYWGFGSIGSKEAGTEQGKIDNDQRHASWVLSEAARLNTKGTRRLTSFSRSTAGIQIQYHPFLALFSWIQFTLIHYACLSHGVDIQTWKYVSDCGRCRGNRRVPRPGGTGKDRSIRAAVPTDKRNSTSTKPCSFVAIGVSRFGECGLRM